MILDLIVLLLEVDPVRRSNANSAKNHEFFSNADLLLLNQDKADMKAVSNEMPDDSTRITISSKKLPSLFNGKVNETQTAEMHQSPKTNPANLNDDRSIQREAAAATSSTCIQLKPTTSRAVCFDRATHGVAVNKNPQQSMQESQEYT